MIISRAAADAETPPRQKNTSPCLNPGKESAAGNVVTLVQKVEFVKAFLRYKPLYRTGLAYRLLPHMIFENLNNADGRLFPSHDTLAEVMGATARAVGAALRQIEDHGWFKVKRLSKSNFYTPVWDELEREELRNRPAKARIKAKAKGHANDNADMNRPMPDFAPEYLDEMESMVPGWWQPGDDDAGESDQSPKPADASASGCPDDEEEDLEWLTGIPKKRVV